MITDRNRRRMAKKTMRKQMTAIRRGAVPALPERPDVDEIFRLDDDGTGNPIFFDVRALRIWARANIEARPLRVEPWRAQRFIETGQVELDHLMQRTIQQQHEPVIVCRQAGGPGEDAIVDGAHRYVAAAMGAAMIGTKPIGYDAFVLEPEQWRPFVLSQERIAEIVAANPGPDGS